MAFLRRAALLLLLPVLLFPTQVRAAEWRLPEPATDVAVTLDGSVWTLHEFDLPYLLRHGDDPARVDLPGILNSAWTIVASPHGGIWIVSNNGVGFVAADGRIVSAQFLESPRAAAVAPDGNLWTTSWAQVVVITPVGEVRTIALPSSRAVAAIAFDADGRAWFASSETLLRVDRDFGMTEFKHPRVDLRWIVAGPDRRLISSAGFVSGDGTLERHEFPGVRPVCTDDGRLWVVDGGDAVLAIDIASGAEALFPAPRVDWAGAALASAGDAVWVTSGMTLRRIDSGERPPDTAPRIGDFAIREYEASGGFPWGTELDALHRTKNGPFTLRLKTTIDYRYETSLSPQFTRDGRLLTVATHNVYDVAESHAILEIGRMGKVSRETPLSLARGTKALALFPHPSGELWLLTELSGNLRLERFSPDALPIGSVPLPETTPFGAPLGFDVAADGCTIGYFEQADVPLRRFNVCTGTDVDDVTLAIAETGFPFRFLLDGRILAATSKEIVLFLPDGVRQRAYPGVYALALDPAAGSFWAATPMYPSLRRIDLETGKVLEEFDLYGSAQEIAIFGEPRARRPLPPRQRGVRRNR